MLLQTQVVEPKFRDHVTMGKIMWPRCYYRSHDPSWNWSHHTSHSIMWPVTVIVTWLVTLSVMWQSCDAP
jgi:hypothetical protein